MRIKRIIIGVLIGTVIGLGLEYVNSFMAFLMPPFFFFLPLTVIIGGCFGAIVGAKKYNRLISKGQGFEHLPVCVADFMRLVIKKMRYRRKVQDDVKAELAAHFEDELKGCKADTEKEQKARQLVAGFGDVKMLAVLLRRAKKRCRPLWRTLFARACKAVVILFVCLVLYVVWFLTGKPVITTNYVAELNRIVRPVADETLNAAPLCHKAAKMFENLPNDISKLLGKKYGEVTAEQRQLMAKWLTDNEEILELVVAGTQKPYYWEEYKTGRDSGEMISVLIPHLGEFRNLARALNWRAQLRAEQGRYADAFNDIKSGYRFGQNLKGDKSLVEQLVACSIENLAARTLRSLLSNHQIDSATLANLQQDLEQLIAAEDFVPSFETEKIFLYDEIQRCFTEDRFGGHLYLSRVGRLADAPGGLREILVETIFSPEGWAMAAKVLFLHPDKRQTREMADLYYAYWDKVARKTPAQVRAEGIDIEKETVEIIKDNILLQIFAPALGRVSEISHRNKTEVEATVTVLSLLRYKADNGSYPKDLQQLITTGYLRQLPTDLYNVKPLIYKKTADSFILYSVGENFEDDGGKSGTDSKGRARLWSGKADEVFWPGPQSQLNQ